MVSRLLSLYREAFRGLPREVWILSIGLFINRCGSMVLPFLVLYLTSQRGFAPSEAGNVLAIYGVGAIVGIAIGGALVDRIGHRAVQAGSLVSSGVALLAFSFLHARQDLLIGAFFLGCLGESFRPANAVALAAFTAPEIRRRAFGLNRLALNLGWTIGPALGGLLAEFDYRYLFWADGATCVASAFFLLAALPASSAELEVPEATGVTRATRSPWRDAVFMAAFALMLMQALVFFQAHSTYSLYLVDELGYTPRVFGLLMIVNSALIVLFEMPLVKAVESRSPLVLVAVSSALVGLGFGLLPVSGSIAWLVFLIVLWTLGEMLTSPTMSAWVASRAGRENRGAYMAAFGITFSIGVAVAPLLGTRIWERFGPDVLWSCCLGMGGLSALGFWALARRDRPGVSA